MKGESSDKTERTTKKRTSICLAICLIFSLLCLAILAHLFTRSRNCTTPTCVKASAQIAHFIDDSVDPCVDFRGFVCGNFLKQAAQNRAVNLLFEDAENLQHLLDAKIVQPVQSEDLQPVISQKQHFQSCMDVENINAGENRVFLQLIQDIGQAARLNGTGQRNDFDWIKATIRAKKSRLPFEWFLKFDLHNDDGQYMLKVSRPTNCEYPMEGYQSVISDTVNSINSKHSIKAAMVVDFQKSLATICQKTNQKKIFISNLSNLKLTSTTVGIDEFVSNIVDRQINGSLKIAYDNYVNELVMLLRVTSRAMQGDYFLWKIIEYFVPFLTHMVRNAYEVHVPPKSRYDFCIEDTKSRFRFYSEIATLREHLTPRIEDVMVFFNSINSKFVDYQRNFQERDNESLIDDSIGSDLEQLITGFNPLNENYILKNHSSIGQIPIMSSDIISRLGEWLSITLHDKMRLIGKNVTVLSLNLEYVTNSTKLDVNQETAFLYGAILESVFYDTERPNYVNYGNLGTLLATELVRRLELAPIYNMSVNTQNVTNDNDTFTMSKINFDFLTGQELAYETLIQNGEEETQLVGLQYTPGQLFWIRSGMNWCDKPDEENRERVEVAKFSFYFAQDFNCPPGSPMNPGILPNIFN